MGALKKPIVFPEIDASGEPAPEGALWPTLYVDLRDSMKSQWTAVAGAYEEAPDDFYRAWRWLQHHPIFWYFSGDEPHVSRLCDHRGVYEGLEFEPNMVNRKTRRIGGPVEEQELAIWVEVFPTSFCPGARNTIRLHDIECVTGAPTYEQAVIEVAHLIYERHGHDRVKLGEIWDEA